MTEGALAEWRVAKGSDIRERAPLSRLKVTNRTNEVESPASGLFRTEVQAGEAQPVGTVRGIIE